jgi:hypothetical protein
LPFSGREIDHGNPRFADDRATLGDLEANQLPIPVDALRLHLGAIGFCGLNTSRRAIRQLAAPGIAGAAASGY